MISSISAVKTTATKIWNLRYLTISLIKREISQRYRGSFLGVFWSLFTPICMLLIYTFVFSLVFKARWSSGDGSSTPSGEFALILFAGITPFTVFSEVVNRSPSSIINVPNYVKKVIFPLEILSPVMLGSALFSSLINVGLLIIARLIIYKSLSASLYLLPFAYLPLIFLTIGTSWFLASLGVYIRDIAQSIPILVQMLMFLSPIFYPIELVPPALQTWFELNPITFIVTSFRQTILWGEPIEWGRWGILTFVTFLLAILGYLWFIKTKKGFPDVL